MGQKCIRSTWRIQTLLKSTEDFITKLQYWHKNKLSKREFRDRCIYVYGIIIGDGCGSWGRMSCLWIVFGDWVIKWGDRKQNPSLIVHTK